MKLRLGKMTSREMAEWFGISYNSYKNHIPKYLLLLYTYCDYEKIYGGVNIIKIYLDTFDRSISLKDRTLYKNEIIECLKTQQGLSTISGMSEKLTDQGEYSSVSTARRRLTEAGKQLFGETKSLTSCGEIGTREYIWAIKLDGYNHYRLLTEDEEKQFDNIITAAYTAEPDKIKKNALLEECLRNKEITSDEYFEIKDNLKLDTFRDCIFRFKELTGFWIVRCTQHEIKETVSFE